MKYLCSILTILMMMGMSVSSHAGTFDTSAYARVLQSFVDNDGYVDYADLKDHPETLNLFVQSLASIEQSSLSKWPEQEQIAFWINAYNALTLKLIIDHYPIKASFFRSFFYPRKSIRQINGAWDRITFNVAGQKMTLNHIEHEILRKQFKEPRIHMALVCAARGCPPLRMEPYDGQRLDEQLNDQTRRFLQDPKKFRIDRTNGVVYLSSIFKWFGSDFVPVYGTDDKLSEFNSTERAVLNFIIRYLDPEDGAFIKQGKFKIKYLKYDWTLNDQKLKQ